MPKGRVRVAVEELPIIFIREGDMFVAYCPFLDLSTAGPTFEEARKNFDEAVGIFFEECVKHKTLDRALASLGWQRSGGHPDRWHPPVVVGQDCFTLRVPATA